MIRPILIHPDPRLKRRCVQVSAFDEALDALAQDMIETMYDAPGIGLAACQIGVESRVLVMDCGGETDARAAMVLVNPVVTWASPERSTYEEGCLSLPGQSAEIERPAEVRVTWQDLSGAEQDAHFTGLWATCVQHEIDHLDGKLFIDYLGPLKRQMITRKMQKLKRERAREGQGPA